MKHITEFLTHWVFYFIRCQKGNDYLSTGSGNDLAIGDAGTNTISTNMNFPRIYQIYRSFESPEGSGYAPYSTNGFGFAFSSDFDLHSNPYRSLDAQGLSLIDLLVTIDDVSSSSNVVRDIFGISSITTANGFSMQPMFKISPGFVTETNILNGDDVLISGEGDDYIIGDDIRGANMIDLTELKAIDDSRQTLDSIIVDLSIRLSTLGYDTEFFSENVIPTSQPSASPTSSSAPSGEPSLSPSMSTSTVGFNITVGCDNITTNDASNAFVAGDILTLVGRTFLGSSFPNPSTQIPQVLERIRDVQQVLTDLNYGLYEIHLDLLQRSLREIPSDFKSLQTPLHSLQLGNDIFDSRGNDTIVGDSATLYFQIDLPTFEDFGLEFEFDVLASPPDLSDIMNEREANLTWHIKNHLKPSTPLSNQEENQLPFADVPFYISIGVDKITLSNNPVVAVGDFAAVGIVYSEEANNVQKLSKYVDSVHTLRKKTGIGSFLPTLATLGNDGSFFYQRYTSDFVKLVEPHLHGDVFVAQSDNNVMFGDYMTAAMFRLGDSYTLDNNMNFYGTFLNAEWAQFFDKDSVYVKEGYGKPIWVGQASNDDVVGTVTKAKADQEVKAHAERFFGKHGIAKQIVLDLYSRPIPYRFDNGGLRNVISISSPPPLPFTIPTSTYVPSHTKSIYIYSTVPEFNHTILEISDSALFTRSLHQSGDDVRAVPKKLLRSVDERDHSHLMKSVRGANKLRLRHRTADATVPILGEN